VLANLMRQVRPVYRFMQKGGVYNDDFEVIAAQCGVKPSVRAGKRSYCGCNNRKGAAVAENLMSVVALLDVVCFFLLPLSIYIAVKGYSESENLAREFAKQQGGSTRRYALGRKRKKRL
jgi:hypothetical protein